MYQDSSIEQSEAITSTNIAPTPSRQVRDHRPPNGGAGLEIYRITADFVSKLILPGVLLFIVLTFRPTINALLGRTTEAEMAGAKFKFAQAELQTADRLSASVSQALAAGKIAEAQATIAKFQKDAAGDVIRAFWKPDGTQIKLENERLLRDWMTSNGFESVPLTIFMRAQNYEQARLKAVRDLALAK